MDQICSDELFTSNPADELFKLRNELADGGVDIIDCSMINPDLTPPRVLLDKLLESVVKLKNHRYAVARGVRKLREGFAFKYDDAFGVKVDPESEICVALGAKDGMLQALRIALRNAQPKRRGASPKRPRVAMGIPYYPVHRSAALCVGAEPVYFQLIRDEDELLRRIEAVVDSSRPHAVVVNFPNNPLGFTVSRAFYERLALISERYGCLVINDFVYGELEFVHGRAESMLQSAAMRERGMEIYSLSKCMSVPGWRVGCVVGPQPLVEQVARLKSHSDYGLFLPFQYAASFALQAGDALIAPQRAAYAERAKVLVQGLRRRGWMAEEVQAGAAVWAKPPASLGEIPSADLARILLERLGILVSAGSQFGWEEPALRIALVIPPERLRELLTRLEGLEDAAPSSRMDSPIESSKLVCERF